MGFTDLGGLAAVLVDVNPIEEAWSVGGMWVLTSIGLIALLVFLIKIILKKIIITYFLSHLSCFW